MELARADLQESQEDLAELVKDIDPLDIEQKRVDLALAKANLAEAEVHLESINDSFPLDVELAEAEITLAQEALDEAAEDYEGAFIRAPFAGIVSQVNVEIDDDANGDSRAIEIIDPSVVEVDGVIDAGDIDSVREGARAMVTIDSLNGRVLEGLVISVDDDPRTERGVVSFAVTIRVDVPNGVELPVNLSGVTISIVGEQTGVIMVPKDAIALNAASNLPVVRIMRDEDVIEQTVSPGISNGTWTIVNSGLTDGDRILVGSQDIPLTQAGIAESTSSDDS